VGAPLGARILDRMFAILIAAVAVLLIYQGIRGIKGALPLSESYHPRDEGGGPSRQR
jgi:hypothetical protein